MAEVLAVIREHDPRRYGRMTNDCDRLWIRVISASLGQYDASLRAIVIDERHLETSTITAVAATIVHEATHARLFAVGLGYEEADRDRVEARCRQEEYAFLQRVPGADREREWIRKCLETPSQYSDIARLDARMRTMERDMAYMKLPSWVTRLLLRYAQWHRTRLARKAKA